MRKEKKIYIYIYIGYFSDSLDVTLNIVLANTYFETFIIVSLDHQFFDDFIANEI